MECKSSGYTISHSFVRCYTETFWEKTKRQQVGITTEIKFYQVRVEYCERFLKFKAADCNLISLIFSSSLALLCVGSILSA